MATRRNVHYAPLSVVDDDDDYNGSADDPRFACTPKSFDKIPWKSILLALFLILLGSMLLFLSFFIFSGHMGGENLRLMRMAGCFWVSWEGSVWFITLVKCWH
ncbi:hypothetical protein MKW94_005629 [Papaver nudicaule]|uniref:Uncharacterized protein n=1 Tax=Papaver nudicaule TaxID=74823 RepID=A0AA41V6Z2_PAPNU|nr:hypothetical protein [Papaver nudicaule]